MEKIFYYNTEVEWKNGRIGLLKETDFPEIEVATPPDFPGGVENIWSPEHLFVAAVNVCLMTTFLAIAEHSKLEFKNFSSKATGKLEKVDGKFMISEIILKPTVVINNERDTHKAERIILKSEDACLISHSIKTKVILEPEIKVS